MREVTGRIIRPDGSPVAYTAIEFLLCDMTGRLINASTEAGEIAFRARARTDAAGRFDIALIENDSTDKQTMYRMRVDDDDVHDSSVTVFKGDGPVDLSDLLRYDALPENGDFDGSIYVTYANVDALGYRFDCAIVEDMLKFIEFFLAHEEGYWHRDDMEAFDALLADMVERNADCVTIQGE